ETPRFVFEKTEESTMSRNKKCKDCEDKDKISQLPDELLMKILLLLPTKTAVSTSILSKRWEYLWMWLPKLEYECYHDTAPKVERLERFISLNLPLHKAPVIESLHLKFNNIQLVRIIEPQVFELWVAYAVSHCIRKLSLSFCHCTEDLARLPSSLYICKWLVVLKLKEDVVIDVPRMGSLPSLKTLVLRRVTYADDHNALHRLLSCCPVLEDLKLERKEGDDLGKWWVFVPSLLRLTIRILSYIDAGVLELKTPSLKYFRVVDNGVSDADVCSFSSIPMPNLEDVDVVSVYLSFHKFVSSIIYVQCLTLCAGLNTQEGLYSEGIVFNQLKHLRLCQCGKNWSKLLLRLLNDSPNLRELNIFQDEGHECDFEIWDSWEDDLNCVPKCLSSSLETFTWRQMFATEQERRLMKYILKNARSLKTATIVFEDAPRREDPLEMTMQEFSLSKGSPTCQLVFEFE
ncbi:hypothetical protein CARUB_v10006534mg, partial [Capsella rubella]